MSGCIDMNMNYNKYIEQTTTTLCLTLPSLLK